jgi:hypothetical protein
MQWLRSARSRQWVAAGLVTAVTAVLIGVVLVAATPLGCGPANTFGLKTISTRCARPLAALSPGTPSPSPSATASQAASPTPSPSSSQSPVFSPSPFPSSAPPDTGPATSAYPPFYPAATGSGGVAIPALRLNCRLPVYAGPPGSGGFIVFPGGAFVADPASAVPLPTPSPGSPTPNPQGGYGSPTGLSYDQPFSRWVPVSHQQVSPDGSFYAFASPSSIYVENVASGVLTEIGQGHAWSIVGVQSAGVYAAPSGGAGLWLLSVTDPPRQITSAGFWQTAAADASYGTPTSAVPQGVTNVIIRVDLKTGATSNWFTRDGAQSTVMGFDGQGHPVIQVSYFGSGINEVWIAIAAGKAVPVTGNGGVGLNINGPVVGDSHGLWMGGNYGAYYSSMSGLALYVPSYGLYWMSNLSAFIAGGCVQP